MTLIAPSIVCEIVPIEGARADLLIQLMAFVRYVRTEWRSREPRSACHLPGTSMIYCLLGGFQHCVLKETAKGGPMVNAKRKENGAS